MTVTLSITLERRERCFERLTGAIGRRGFEVVGANVRLSDDGEHLHVRFTLESDRAVESLVRHVSNLHDVTQVVAR